MSNVKILEKNVDNLNKRILIYMMVLCTQVNKMYVIATLSVYPHRASLKNMPGHGGIRTYDLWNASPMLCQLSYAVRLSSEISYTRTDLHERILLGKITAVNK